MATADDVSQLQENEAWTDFSSNTIYIRRSMPASRIRDALVHEVMCAFFEASGVGDFLAKSIRFSPEELDAELAAGGAGALPGGPPGGLTGQELASFREKMGTTDLYKAKAEKRPHTNDRGHLVLPTTTPTEARRLLGGGK